MTADRGIPDRVREGADLLMAAEQGRVAREPLTQAWADLDATTAWAIQDEVLRRRLARGERLIGVKLGLTSRAKQQRMGIDAPLTGWLTDAMVLAPGEAVALDAHIHPRVEPEIAFVLGRDLSSPGVTTVEAMGAVDTVLAGLEVIDSRYADYRFSLADVIADNASASRLALGSVGRSPRQLDLELEAALLEVDGSVVDAATGAAVQGHPGAALALAANALAARGLGLQAGWVVLTGGMTDAVPLTAGSSVAAHFTSLGSVHLPRPIA